MSNNEMNIVQSTVTRRPVRRRGILSSQDTNDLQDEIVNDIQELSTAVNSLNSRLTRSLVTVHNENAFLRRQLDQLLRQKDYIEQVAGSQGFLASRMVDFSDTTGITFPNELDDSFSAMVSAEFGEATLPPSAIENKFYVSSLRTGRIVVPSDFQATVKGTFDKGQGAGLVNYERGGIVTPGNPEWAFNGNNRLYWQRRVEFPIDSKIDQVECELVAIVPDGTSTQANLIEVRPFPNGSVDVMELGTSSDLGTVFTTVPGFVATDNLQVHRWHFAPVAVEQVKIRLRQRNWVEENGKKVFYYGLQELGLKLVDYDKSWTPGSSFGTNHTFVVDIPAPTGYVFDQLFRIDPQPNFLLEDISQRHVHLRLSSTPDFTGTKLWDSDVSVPPQDTGTTVGLQFLPRIYAIFQLNFVDQTGGVLSPYTVGTTPYIRGLGLSYGLLAV